MRRLAAHADPEPCTMPRRPSLTGLALRQIAFLCLLASLGIAGLVASGHVVLPYRYDPFAPLDLRAPRDWLSSYRLSRLKADGALCRRVLTLGAVPHRPLPDRPEPEDCGLTDGVELAAEASSLDGRITARCGIAAGWMLFEQQVLQPAARQHLGQEVRRALHLGTYVCRRIGGPDSRFSQHATANAIDIAGFVLTDGRRITLLRDWVGEGPEARFLRAVRDGACAIFEGVLGPEFNAAHADHFHFDNGPFRVCR